MDVHAFSLLGGVVGGAICGASFTAFYLNKSFQKKAEALKKVGQQPDAARELLEEVTAKLNSLKNAVNEEALALIKEVEDLLKKEDYPESLKKDVKKVITELDKRRDEAEVVYELREVCNELKGRLEKSKGEGIKSQGTLQLDEELVEKIREINGEALRLSKWVIPAGIKEKSDVGKSVTKILQLTKEVYDKATQSR